MTSRAPFRRKVFYLPGYDPIPPRRYRELYRTESRDQARIAGYEITQSPLKSARFGWRVESVMDGRATDAEIEVLLWADIVRDSMGLSIAATYAQAARTAWAYIGSGALWGLMKLRRAPVLAALYPVGMLLLYAALALGAGALAVWALGLLPLGPLNWLALPAVAYAVLRGLKRIDGRLFVFYLMHDYAYSAASNGANPPALDARISEFATDIRAALAGGYDEVLVVGHSSGAHLGVMILAELMRREGPGAALPGRLSFLTLGHVVPMVSFLPEAHRLRADLAALSVEPRVTWVDISAPGDPACFALCDPVAVSGVAPELPPDATHHPRVLSAAFSQTLTAERWNAMKRRFFRLHFQYLCAFDDPGPYDYFATTAGPLTLAERFGTRPPSASRITRAVNPHPEVTP